MPSWSWNHIGPIIAAVVLLVFFYAPPKTAKGLGKFIERHFGDSVGFYILHLGIILVVIGGIWPQVSGVTQTGNSLILAGMGILKLSKDQDAPPKGVSQASTSTSTTNPPPALPPPLPIAGTTTSSTVIGKKF